MEQQKLRLQEGAVVVVVAKVAVVRLEGRERLLVKGVRSEGVVGVVGGAGGVGEDVLLLPVFVVDVVVAVDVALFVVVGGDGPCC